MKKVISLLFIASFLFAMGFVLAEDNLTGGCAGVMPSLQDECCVNSGYASWDETLNQCVPELIGGCGTVTPGLEDECCVNSGYASWNSDLNKCVSADQISCENADGTWTTFNNGCADSCDYVREPNSIMCTQAITEGCECGEDMCWNGVSCENNEEENETEDNETNSEKVCCKIYGYGAEMVEVNVRYEFTTEERCSVADDFVGGNREIVDNSYCKQPREVKPIQERKAIAVQQVIQARNRLQIMVQNSNGTCPENCTCTGSGMKCNLGNGSREMIIRAGNSGNTIVQVKNHEMNTNVALFKADDGQVFGVFKGEQTKRIILPDEAAEKAREKLQERIKEKERNRKRINYTNENITLNEDGYYEIQAKKRSRLFWIIPVKEKMETQIDAETGSIIKQRYPWWGFLARDVREDISEE